MSRTRWRASEVTDKSVAWATPCLIRKHPFPSPQPSPPGRGSFRFGEFSTDCDRAKDWLRFPVFLGERAVRHSMALTVKLSLPEGVLTSTASPIWWPSRARPIGDSLEMRPVAGWARYRTPVQGLFLCGSGAHPGGGVMGAPGYNCAREMLKIR